MSLEPQLGTPSPLDTELHSNTPNPPNAPKSHWKSALKWAVFALIVFAVILFTWRHFHSGTKSAQAGGQGKRGGGVNQIMPVQAKVLVAGDLRIFIDALGSVVPKSSVVVHTRVDGELMSVNFTEGQVVKKGDLLFQIDPRPYQVALTQVEGQLAKDKATLVSAMKDLVRYQSLVKVGSVSAQQLDDQVSLVEQAKGSIKADQGQVDSAQLNLTYSRVTAPSSGKLGLRLVDPGNIVHASDTNGVVVINQFQPIYVTYSIPEDSVPSVLKQTHAGNVLQVAALDRAQKNTLDNGQLVSLDNSIDPTTGTLKLKAQFANTSENLFPSQFVNVHMLVETQHNVPLLPSAAIQRGANGTFVFVVNADSTVTATPVTLGAVDGDNTGVISGVNAGAQVVFDGADKLKDGGKVKVIDPSKASTASDSALGAPVGGHGRRHHQTAS
jgi:multidrug efflux system membrane fusion protein